MCAASVLQVNSQVIKPEERALLSRLVSIMVMLELRFVQEKSEDGQLVYRLDPSVPWLTLTAIASLTMVDHRPLDVFVTYEGKRASDITISRYATRHLVAGEVSQDLLQDLMAFLTPRID